MTDDYTNYTWTGEVDESGIPEAAPANHTPVACLQIHEPETSIEKIESDAVWIRLDCEECGDGRMIQYFRGGSENTENEVSDNA